MATIISIDRQDSTSYDFTINLDAAFGVATTIRWAIVPIGELPVILSTPISGEVEFGSSATTEMINVGVTPTRQHQNPRDFEIRLYREGETDPFFTEAAFLAGDSTLSEDTRLLSGRGDNNVVGLGFSDEMNPVNAGVGDDTFIITRFQYGDVTIQDSSIVGAGNLIKFDYGVTITGYREESVDFFGIVIQSAALTLSTGAVITIELPDDYFVFQLGNGALRTYSQFKADIKATGTYDVDTQVDTNNFAGAYAIDSFTDAAVLSGMREEAGDERRLSGRGNEDILSIASDYDLTVNAGVGDDTFIITRFQYGDVTIQDSSIVGAGNLIKFDYGVTITGYREESVDFFGIVIQSAALTLLTGAVITIELPDDYFVFQLGNGALRTYSQFKADIKATGTYDVDTQVDTNNFAGDYAIPFPTTTINTDPEFVQDAYSASVDASGVIDDVIATLVATDADGDTVTYHITLGNDGDLFEIKAGTNEVSLTRPPQAAIDGNGYTLTIEARDANGGVDTATLRVEFEANRVTEDTDVKYSYLEKIGVADSVTSSSHEEVTILTTAGDAVSVENIMNSSNTEIIGYRATGTYGIFEYYLFGKGWNYNVNSDDPDTIAKAGAPISEEFVFEITPTGGTAFQTSVNVNILSSSSNLEATGDLDIGDPTIITGVTISGDASSVQDTGSHLLASTLWGALEFDTTTGDWRYTLDNDDPDFQKIKSGDSLTETFVFEITRNDGTPVETRQVVIKVNGADEDIYFVDEDGNEVDAPPSSAEITTTYFSFPDPATISGTILQSLGEVVAENAANANVAYGVLTFNAAANFWEYTLNHEHTAVKALAIGETLTDTIAFDTTPTGGGATTTETIEIKIALGHQGIFFADENGDVITLPRGKQYFPQDGSSDQYVTASGGPFDITLDLNNPAVTSPNGLALGDILPEIGGLIDIRSAQVAFADSVSVDSPLRDIFYISGDGALSINPIGTDAEVQALLAGLGDSVTLDLVVTAPSETDEELTYSVVVNVINGDSNVLTTIPEDASVGDEVGRLESFTEKTFFNPNEVGTATRTYEITAGNAGGVFAIDNNGVITLAPTATLNAETTASYTLSITATYDPDGDSSTTNDIETHRFDVVINVGDVNEHNPAFAADAVAWRTDFTSGNIPENTEIGAHLATITASDADRTSNLNYAITGGNDDDIFAISPISGRLTLNGALDFEDSAINNSYTLTITAYDGDKTDADTKSSTTTVTITVTDVAPEFGANPVAWASGFANGIVAEDTYTNAPVTLGTIAADAQGNNNALTYTIIGGNDDGVFSLSAAGALSLVKPLDAETIGRYSLTIQVSDGTTTADTTTITINVGDVNEHAPSAPTISWAADFTDGNVAENTRPDTPLATVSATDADAGADLQYSISGTGNDLFDIDSNGYLILKGRLDFETTPSYDLMITASDGTNTAPPTAITITVTDSDPDFNSVTWESGFANGAVAEDTATGTAIATFAVTHSKPGIFFRVNDDAFAVDNDGKLRLTRKLDYETTTQHNLRVIVSDGTSSDFIDVVVTVQDSDLEFNAPIWETAFANGVIAEDATPAKIATITAQRDDATSNNVRYSIVGGNGGNVFSIDANGDLNLASGLDYDIAPSYRLIIRATDDNAPSSSTDLVLEIEVANVNKDTPTDPTITWEGSFETSVAEDTAIGTLLASASSEDGDDDETVTYSISGTGSNLFDIDSETGAITLAGALDFETTPSYDLTITASDGTKTATTDITITVGDVDPELVWAEGFADGIIAETTDEGTHIATLTKDADNTATLTYAITDGSSGGVFTIDEDSGAITLTGALDYATTTDYTLSVQVTDAATNTVITTTEVHIRVGGTEMIWEDGVGYVDADNNPVTNTANIGADTEFFMLLGSFSHNRFADDAVSYAITGGDNVRFAIFDDKLYFINNTVRVVSDIYTLTITATDGTLTDSTNIVINVGNQNAPVFASQPVVWEAGFADDVREDTAIDTILGRVDASDADGSTLTYYLVDSAGAVKSSVGAFSIDADTGAITLTSALDYATATSHDLTIRVSDGFHSVDTDISIAVEDVRYKVVWGANFADGNVGEDTTTGRVLATITPDTTSPTQKYQFVVAGADNLIDGAFTINEATGVITLTGALDHETASHHTLAVRITDSADADYNEYISVVVNVGDVYDPAAFAATPVIWQDNGVFAENTAIGTELGRVDVQNSESAQLRYFFVDNGVAKSSVGAFTIGLFDGVIRLADYLDHETASSHNLNIRVFDGTSNIDTTASFTVTNRDPEVLWGEDFVNGDVNEDTQIGAAIATITPDTATASQRFNFANGTTQSGAFTINEITGVITLTSALNYETAPVYALEVRVNDGGSHQTVFVNIGVVDVNDAPVFAATPVVWGANFAGGNVDEDTAIGTVLGQAQATDGDGDRLYYYFVDENGATTTNIGAFAINFLNGEISLAGSLDYENATSHDLTIRVRDGFGNDVKSADVAIPTITVNNVENEVVWGANFVDGNVNENTLSNAALGTITPDGANPNRQYTLVTPTDGTFSVGLNTGDIALTGPLDYESATSHTLTVRITDSVDSSYDETITITINVDNEIETTTQWQSGFANGNVGENTAIGTHLATIIPQGESAGLNYRITDGNTGNVFAIDGNGRLTLNLNNLPITATQSLDYETQDSYTLTIQLTNPAGDITTTSLTITISDENDAPIFRDDEAPVTWNAGFSYVDGDGNVVGDVSANTPANTPLGTLNAHDSNGDTLTYTIVDGNDDNLFAINGDQIVLVGSVASLDASAYRLTIRVSDGTFTDDTDIVINVGNENAPVFAATPVIWQEDFETNGVSEGLPAGTIIAQAQATDAQTRAVLYQLVDGNGASVESVGAFVINVNSGHITLNERLDYETATSHTLTIRAHDSHVVGGGRFSEHEITINVKDIDDYVEWNTGSGFENGNVNEDMGAVLGDAIGRVRSDIEGENDNLRFHFIVEGAQTSQANYFGEDTTDIGRFNINEKTGEISLSSHSPNFERGSSYTLTVQISDITNKNLPRTLDVTVNIVDINEGPSFTQGTYAFTVAENAPIAIHAIGRVVANDVDAGDTLTYRLREGDATLFAVDRDTGDISLKRALDYDSATSHQIKVQVEDAEGLFAIATVNIGVTEYTPAAPTLTVTGTATIVEQETASTDVVNAGGAATINVASANAFPDYSFAVTNDARFQVVEINGVWTLQLKAGAVLDYATASTITLTLQVTDAGETSAPQSLTVTVLDRPELSISAGANVNLDVVGTTTELALDTVFAVADADTDLNAVTPVFDISVVSGTTLEASDFNVQKVGDAWTLHYIGAPIVDSDFLDPFMELDVKVSTEGASSPDAVRVRLNLNDGTYLQYGTYPNDGTGKFGLYKIYRADYFDTNKANQPVTGIPETQAGFLGSNVIRLDQNYNGDIVNLSHGDDIYFVTNDIDKDISIADVVVDDSTEVNVIRLDTDVEIVGYEEIPASVQSVVSIAYNLTLDTDGNTGTTDDQVLLQLKALHINTDFQFQQGAFGDLMDFSEFAPTFANLVTPEVI